MFKSEKGDTYVNWVIIILVVLIFSAIIIRGSSWRKWFD